MGGGLKLDLGEDGEHVNEGHPQRRFTLLISPPGVGQDRETVGEGLPGLKQVQELLMLSIFRTPEAGRCHREEQQDAVTTSFSAKNTPRHTFVLTLLGRCERKA